MFAGFLMPSNLRRILGVLLTIVQASDAVEVRLPLYASLIDLLSLCLPGDPLAYDAPKCSDSHGAQAWPHLQARRLCRFPYSSACPHRNRPIQAMPKCLLTSCRQSYCLKAEFKDLSLRRFLGPASVNLLNATDQGV